MSVVQICTVFANCQKNSEIAKGDDGEGDDSECYVHSQLFS